MRVLSTLVEIPETELKLVCSRAVTTKNGLQWVVMTDFRDMQKRKFKNPINIKYRITKKGLYEFSYRGKQIGGEVTKEILDTLEKIAKNPGFAILYKDNEDISIRSFAQLALETKIILKRKYIQW